jgi:hypothetical protein
LPCAGATLLAHRANAAVTIDAQRMPTPFPCADDAAPGHAAASSQFELALRVRQPPSLAEVGEHRARRRLDAVGGARQRHGPDIERDGDRGEVVGGDRRPRRRAGEIALDANAEEGGADRRQPGRQCDEVGGVGDCPPMVDEIGGDERRAAVARRREQQRAGAVQAVIEAATSVALNR